MSDPSITRGPATVIGAASVYSAAVAYVTLLIAARTLSPSENAIFLVYWALLFGAYGVVTGVTPEAARATYRGPGKGAGASVLGVALVFGALVAVAIAGTAGWWAPRVLHDQAWLALVAAVACFAYTGHLAVWGLATGGRRWSVVAGLTLAEATVRLGLILLALWLYGTLTALAIAAALPALTWVVGQVVPVLRRTARGRSDVRPRRLLRNYAIASLASSASALLMVGFPVLISVTSTPTELAGAAALMLGISLTRAPLLVPLSALQGVALTHFLHSRHQGHRALWLVIRPLLCVTAAGAALAYLVGPWLFTRLLGSGYTLAGGTLALLTVSAGLLAALTLTGMFALALHLHGLFAAGWISATVVAVLLLLVPLPLTDRALLSLLAGPALGVVVHAVGLFSVPSAARGSSSPEAPR